MAAIELALSLPQFEDMYDGEKMRNFVDEIERLHAALTVEEDAVAAGDVNASGTPVDNQVAVWVSDTEIEGDAGLTWDGLVLQALKMISGDPGTEGSGITVNGVTYESSHKVSDIGGTNVAQLILHRHSTTLPALIIGARTADNTSAHTVVADNDILMTLLAAGHDGTDYALSSEIRFEVDGTPGSNDMPGRIVFMTSADGAQTPTARMRILSDGTIEFIDNILDRPVLKDYALSSTASVVAANAVTFTYSDSNSHEVDLEAATGTVAITVSGGPPSGTYGEMVVKVQQDSTADRVLTWAGGTFIWAVDGLIVDPKTGSDAITIYHLQTWDGGTTWYISGVPYGV